MKKSEMKRTGFKRTDRGRLMIRDSVIAFSMMAAMTSIGAADIFAEASSDLAVNTADLFTERDLEQSADLSEAVTLKLADGEDQTITEEGVYIISGKASDATIIVDAADDAKVQLVLDGAEITNADFPCIYVKNADKVFVTTTGSDSALTVTGAFTADGDTNTDAVIFSRDDLVLNGTSALSIQSSDNGIACKDDLKITGGTLDITCVSDALEANESIAVADGDITIRSEKDGLHAENDEDTATGYICITGDTLDITAADDAIHATTVAQIDGGSFTLEGTEGLEATVIFVNDGEISISAADDGINASQKSDISTPVIEFNGGSVTIAMGAGDTDAVDVNGNLYINDGTLNITAQSPFDIDGQYEKNGGTLIVNGEETTEITNQFMGGMGGFGMNGGQGGFGMHGAAGQDSAQNASGQDSMQNASGQQGFGNNGNMTPPEGMAPGQGMHGMRPGYGRGGRGADTQNASENEVSSEQAVG